MSSKLREIKDNDILVLTLPHYEYIPLNHEAKEVRFLVVHPCDGDKTALENHVKCHIEVQALATEDPLPFIAVYHARAYRKWHEAIEIDGKGLSIPVAIEVFLRHFRRSDEPVRLWIRYICLDQYDEHEFGICWNRTFVDFVYDKATTKVNVAEFNAELVESGTTKTFTDAQYQKWQKKWNTLPEHNQLPSVYPYRLGKKPSDDKPDGFLDYVALDTIANEIRVLVILPSEDPIAPLIADLGYCPLLSEVAFHALSYVWGAEDETEIIVVSGQKAVVRQNLANALRALRQPQARVSVWVDAICIDQKNLAERNRQIKRISQVYDRAVGVICYIGEPDEDSKMALDFVKYLQHPMMRMDDNRHWICRNRKDEHKSHEELPRLCGALYRLLTRPYFRRVWILQEVAWASNPTIACGKDFETPVTTLDTAAYNLLDMLTHDSELAQRMIEVTPGITRVSENDLAYIRNLTYFRHVLMKGSEDWLRHFTFSKTSPGTLESAIMARKFEATVASDKIYALWNLANDKGDFSFKMDYSQSTEEAYTSFTIAWTKHSGSLDMIGAAELNIASIDFYSTAPSWCPNWSVPSEVSSMIRKEVVLRHMMQHQGDLDGQLYHADGGMKQTPTGMQYFYFDQKTLHCTGIIIDKITLMLDTPLKPDGTRTFEDIFYSAIEYSQDQIGNQYDDPVRAAWAMSTGDNIAAWPIQEENPENVDKDYPEELYVCLPALARHVRKYADSYSRSTAAEARKMVLRGREMIFTAQGYIGLGPNYVRDLGREGNVWIAILATCSAPVLLMEQSPGLYKFVGTCFVQGWMDGEIVTEYMGAETAEEFWKSMEDVEKLKIV